MGEFITDDYATLVAAVKAPVGAAQYEALRAGNKELVALYWDIGKILADRQSHTGSGKAIVERLAQDLRAEFPGIGVFSSRNLWYMRDFHSAYVGSQKLQPLVAEIGWSHNVVILDKCKDTLEREFYLRMTAFDAGTARRPGSRARRRRDVWRIGGAACKATMRQTIP